MYADVILEMKNKQTDQTFTYHIPKNLEKLVSIGKRVKVPFNKRTLTGFILNISSSFKGDFKVLDILEVIDEEIILTPELLDIAQFVKDSTLCSLSSCISTMLPKALKSTNKTKINKKYTSFLVLNNDYQTSLNLTNNKTQNEIIALFKNTKSILKSTATDISISSTNTLIKKGILKEELKETYRLKTKKVMPSKKYPLNKEQLNAYQKITSSLNKHQKFLLYGVTGSGKTEVYMQVIERVLKNSKTALVLVPEISLTPQFVNVFAARFPNTIAILHSHLSDGERYDEWRRINKGEVKIVIGARSAVFAPLKNLGIIVVDEEHADAYKQENSPKYNAIDIAEYRALKNNIPIVLGSATPTLERMAKASKNLYELLVLPKRIHELNMPNCQIIDMAKELKKGNAILSDALKVEIEASISRNEQVILLLNRRGYATTITCNHCGFTYKCPNCDITLTYHKTKNMLRCHYCGYTKYAESKCPKCNEDINFFGLGTEKLEDFVKSTYPDLRILRMDTDTTTKKNSHEIMLEKFKNYEYDILLGTQMISKGLDFPRVSLVGIINADTTLNLPDFRSGEKTFSLLYQASGRAGRSNTIGNVIIQTFNPENYILKCVAEQNYPKFYQYEMKIRHQLKYPPYYYLVSLKVTSHDYNLASIEANKCTNYLKNNLSPKTIILGPTPANIFKMNNIYRFQIIIKYRLDTKLIPTLKTLDKIFTMNNKVNLDIDLNPTQI